VPQVIRRFLVTGKVQGVYFRHSTRAEAERLGIRGVARNLPDGSVEVIAHGTQAAVEELRDWLHRGPRMARVASVQELAHGNSASGQNLGVNLGQDLSADLGKDPSTEDRYFASEAFLVE
jgi:acylphosphatase